jgi:hypothetical protein
MIAEATKTKVIVNGGRNVGIKPEAQFKVMEQERVITDPLTGDVIERRKGVIKGLIRVTEILETSSHGSIIEGSADRGDWLEPVIIE